MVNAGTEPIEFTNLFPSWNENKDVQAIVSKVSTFIYPFIISLSVYHLSVYQSIFRLTVNPSMYQSVYYLSLYICSSIHLSVCPSIHPSICSLFIYHCTSLLFMLLAGHFMSTNSYTSRERVSKVHS